MLNLLRKSMQLCCLYILLKDFSSAKHFYWYLLLPLKLIYLIADNKTTEILQIKHIFNCFAKIEQ